MPPRMNVTSRFGSGREHIAGEKNKVPILKRLFPFERVFKAANRVLNNGESQVTNGMISDI
jgi:hypothetical protein